MPLRSLNFLVMLLLAFAVPVEAEVKTQVMAQELRAMRGDAIISAQPNANGGSADTNPKLNRLLSPSFSALSNERLSKLATRISLKRKKGGGRSELFRRSRNTCSSLVMKRVLRVTKDLNCEPNWEGKISLTSNDQYYSSLYSVNQLNLPDAWDLSTGSDRIIVGVIDTGIDYEHPDLAANIWTNPGDIANGIDDDGNGYIDDLHGIDRVNLDTDPFDDQSHGTHVAGTIGAVGNNSIGVVGINWNVKMIGCKAFNASGTGSTAAVISCLNYLVNLKTELGINIVATSNSYGGFPYSLSMYNAIAATRDAGMVFVAGAGNNGTNNDSTPFYPASYDLDNIISVAANNSSMNKAGFSNYGASSVDISAPGVSVLSTIPGPNQYAWFNGTSMATPHVTGAVALLMSYCESCSYSQAISSILNSGTSVTGLSGTTVTGSILNVAAALQYAAALPIPTPTPTPTPEPSEPTPVPTDPPGDELDLGSATLEILAVNSRARSSVTCALRAKRGGIDEALVGRTVGLSIKGDHNSVKKKTNHSGNAVYKIRPPKGVSWVARCIAKLTDAETGAVRTVTSPVVKLRLKKR